MTSAPSTARAEADRCPGVLRPHRAADGALLRLRLPGGRLQAESLGILGDASRRYGNGEIQLTSRGNLQLRGVATDANGAVSAELVDEVVRAGLLPRPSHERVRNIVCSPLTGLLAGQFDLRPMTRLLDQKLCAERDLADLPGPFLFVLDDGRGDVAGLQADLGAAATATGIRLRVGNMLVGSMMAPDAAVASLITLAKRFLPFTNGSHPVWHVRGLPRGGRELLPPSWQVERAPVQAGPTAPFGPLTQNDGRTVLSALVPLGLLTADQVEALVAAAGAGSGELVVTPWRGVLVPGLDPGQVIECAKSLVDAGLELGADPAWRGITACTGAPRCAHGQGATRSLAAAVAAGRGSGPVDLRVGSVEVGRPTSTGLLPVHVIGCSRRCGSPSGEHVELLSDGSVAHISCAATTVEVPLTSAAMTARQLRKTGVPR